MGNDRAEASRDVAHTVLWEFAKACERDVALGADYLRARDLWQDAATDDACDDADDAFIDILERFTDARGANLTGSEVQSLRALRDTPDSRSG